MKLHDDMMCPVCKKGKMYRKKKKLNFSYQGNITEIEAYVYECNLCKESIFDDNVNEDIDNVLSKIRYKIDFGGYNE